MYFHSFGACFEHQKLYQADGTKKKTNQQFSDAKGDFYEIFLGRTFRDLLWREVYGIYEKHIQKHVGINHAKLKVLQHQEKNKHDANYSLSEIPYGNMS